MAIIKLKKDKNAKHFELNAVQDVKVNGTSVFDGEEANINIKSIDNQELEGTGNIDINAVKYIENQGLTTEQKLNARNNIDAYMKPANNIPKTDLSNDVQSSLDKADSAVQDVSDKQNIIENALTTINKTIPTAINEVNSIAKGANQALCYSNYSSMVSTFNLLSSDVYNIGQNIMIITLEVPDLWISGVESTSSTYTYTTDTAITDALETNGYIQVGYYKLSALETQKVDLSGYEPILKKKTLTNTSSNYSENNNIVTVTDTDVTTTNHVDLYPTNKTTEEWLQNNLVSSIITQSNGSFTFETKNALPATFSMYYIITEVV